MIDKDKGTPTVWVSLRLEEPIERELQTLAEAFSEPGEKWSKSDVLRYFIKIGYIMHHPDSVVPAREILKALPETAILDPDTLVPVHRLLKTVIPSAVDRITQAAQG
jgi:hypothetical protein